MATLTAPSASLFALPAVAAPRPHMAAAEKPNWFWYLFLAGLLAFACAGPACQLG